MYRKVNKIYLNALIVVLYLALKIPTIDAELRLEDDFVLL